MSDGTWESYIEEKISILEKKFADLPKAGGQEMLADVRAISQAWLAGIAHQITQCPKEERKIWEKALKISGEYYNKLSEHFR